MKLIVIIEILLTFYCFLTTVTCEDEVGPGNDLHFISADQSEIYQRIVSTPTLEVCFLVDLTWSMAPYMQGVKSWMRQMVELLNSSARAESREFDLRLSFVGYRDFEDASWFVILPFGAEASDFLQFITEINPEGGGDVSEDVLGALDRVSKLNWTPDNNVSRVLFHFGDGPCHHEMCRPGTSVDLLNRTAEETFAKLRDAKVDYYFGQLTNRTQIMVKWFQLIYGLQISVFDLGFNESLSSGDNSKKKDYITIDDIKNVDLDSYRDSQNSTETIEFPWDENLFEGDIDLQGQGLSNIVDTINGQPVFETLSDFLALDNAVAEKHKLWPDALIPYTISPKFNDNQRAAIGSAMETFHRLTCIRWVSRWTTQKDYVTFTLGPISPPACRSSIGRNSGSQEVTLSFECFKSIGFIMHEMMHTIGFVHEQSRNDRDNYIKIVWENVAGGRENANFQTYGMDKIDNLETNYDYSSIMHYPRALSGVEFIRPLIDVEIGKRQQLSETDIYKINKLYGCLEDDTPVCDPKIVCVQRAQNGECLTNPYDMLTDCRKYCSLCHKKPANASDIDEENDDDLSCWDSHRCCATWETKFDQCRLNSDWMLKNCKVTCGVCNSTFAYGSGEADCKNYFDLCQKWGSQDECTANREWMEMNCRDSCDSCHLFSEKAMDYCNRLWGDGSARKEF